MDPDSWNRIKELVTAARDLPTAEREAYLDEACFDDPELRREVESLLTADLDAAAFVEEPMLRLLDEPAGQLKEGDQIGAYEIQCELGRGGMGVVYLATRADAELERQVAIKVLRPGLESEEIDRRFRQEIQILANLTHPNIAQLYDVDRTEDGRLYFLMEHVEGQHITTYCDEQKLSITRRLKLFRRVCAAVQHAHQNLVVHRDLKPSNILVTTDGVPKLVDFGIAKLLEPDGSASLTNTATGLQPLTPKYASPEQLFGRQITTVSDVFSLGVVLYEILTGSWPYRLKQRTTDEVKRVICEEEPEKPSTAVPRGEELPRTDDSTIAPTPGKIRDGHARRLQRRLEGDLDTIVLMALRKTPERRYSSVADFAEDIERHLSGLPVRAQKDTWLYRAGKYVRRNQLRLAAVLLLVGLGTVLLINNFLHQKQLERERDKFQYIATFLTDLFKVSDPIVHSERNLTARDLLDQAAQRIATTSQEPEIRADLAQTVGKVYAELGLYEDGKELLGQALDLRREIFGPRHDAVAESLLNHGVALSMMGRADEAIRDLEESVEIRRSTRSKEPDLAKSLSELAQAFYRNHANYQAAELFQLEALEIRRRLSPESADVAESLNYLGLTYKDQQRYPEAESVFAESLAIHTQLHGPDSVKAATPMHNLALVYRAQERFEEAEEYHRRSLMVHEAAYGPNHPAVATGLNVLGLFLKKQERYQEALPIYRRSLNIHQSLLGDEHPSTNSSRHNLGSLYLAMGDLETANQILEKALAIGEKILPRNHPSLGSTLFKLANLRVEQARYKEAEAFFKRTIALLESNNHPRTMTARKRYAEFLRILGREKEAIALEQM